MLLQLLRMFEKQSLCSFGVIMPAYQWQSIHSLTVHVIACWVVYVYGCVFGLCMDLWKDHSQNQHCARVLLGSSGVLS